MYLPCNLQKHLTLLHRLTEGWATLPSRMPQALSGDVPDLDLALLELPWGAPPSYCSCLHPHIVQQDEGTVPLAQRETSSSSLCGWTEWATLGQAMVHRRNCSRPLVVEGVNSRAPQA